MRFLILFIAVVAMGGSIQGRVAFEKLTELDYRGTTYYTIRNLSLYECQGWCREEPDCAAASFSFVANPLSPVQETVCLLQNETAASNPSSIPQKAVSLYYMVKLNLRSDNVCNRPWTFERVPNKILRGLDNALIFTSTKEACLAACLNERRFTCRSAEYNYVTLQCHLSEYDRRSVDEFVDLVDAQGVDYFENLCLKSSEACKGNRTYKVPSIGVPEEKVAQHVDVHYYVDKELLANNQQACQRACQIENEFLCRSYLYKGPPDGMIYNCQLFHMDHKTLLDGPNAYLNSERPLLDNGEPVGTYYENVCEKPASTPDAVQSGWPASSAQTQESSTVSSALTGTSGSGSTSGSSTTGSGNKPGGTSGSSTSGSGTSGSGSGSTSGSTGSGSSNSGIITGGSSGTGTTTGRPQVTNGGPWPSTSGSGSGLSPSGLPAWGPGTGGGAGANAPTDINCDYTGTCYDVEVNCRDTKIEVLVRTNRPFNGRIYSLGRSETCNVDVINSDTFRLDLSMSGQDCNTQSMGGMFTNTVVLQHHSVVMTKADKIYKIKCTYDMSSRNVSFGMMPIRDPDMISITSAPEAPPPRIRIVDANGREVETVRIGDRLTFRVEIPGDTPYGIFARSCVAMAKDARSTFQIIDDDGCPVDPSIFPRFVPDGTALQSTYEAFRFTESYGVIFQCNVRYCLGPCEPAVCPWGRESYESWGRKKRSVADKDTTERKDDDMMLSQEILVLDFEDENRLTRQPLPTIEIDDVKPSHNRSISITEEISMYSGTCPTKASVLALAVTCALLLLLYICTVFYILMKRFFQPRKCDM